MIRKADPSSSRRSVVGADIGATLAKLAIRGADGRIRYRLVPSRAIDQVTREVESLSPQRVGLTGGGAAELACLLGTDTVRADEFAAWRRGAVEMLRREDREPSEPFLLVSLGTGTSVMLVKGEEVVRVGGTALGGGTIIGLGAALTGHSQFAEIVELAAEGDRRNVDLLVSDIYPTSELPLPADLNAASFAKLARPGHDKRADPRDLAHAVMGMVAENVGLICGGLATSVGVRRIVYGGSTLRGNRPLVDVLRVMAQVAGFEAVFLGDPEFAGALGALSLAMGTGPLESL